MIKKIYLLFAWLMFTNNVFAQRVKDFSYAEIPVVSNLDSLENVVLNKNLGRYDLLRTYLILEKSRIEYSSYKVSSNLKQIDSLLSYFELPQANYFFSFLVVKKYLMNIELNSDSAFNKFLEMKKQISFSKDTLCLLHTYYYIINLFIKPESVTLIQKERIKTFVLEAEELAKNSANIQLHFLVMRIHLSVARGYKNMKEYEKYLNLYTDMVNKYECLNNYKLSNKFERALFFGEVKNYRKAIELYNECIQETINSEPRLYVFSVSNLAYIYMDANDYLNASVYLKLAINLELKYSKAPDNYIDISENYKRLAQIKFIKEEYDSAWLYRDKADSFNALIPEIKNKQQLIELQEKYQVDKKEIENKEIDKQRMYYRNITIIVIVFSTLLVFVLFYLFQQNKKIKALSNFKTKVHGIISHDLRSPLTGLTQLYEQYNYWAKKNEPQQLEKISDRIDEASANMNNLVNNILLWNTNFKTNQKQNLLLHNTTKNVVNLYSNILQAQNIVVVNNILQVHTITANNNVVELIIRNWIDNVIKHARPTQIVFETAETVNTTTLYIKDNGKINQENLNNIQALLNNKKNNVVNSFGLGLLLIAEFAAKENWLVQLTQVNNQNMFSITFS